MEEEVEEAEEACLDHQELQDQPRHQVRSQDYLSTPASTPCIPPSPNQAPWRTPTGRYPSRETILVFYFSQLTGLTTVA